MLKFKANFNLWLLWANITHSTFDTNGLEQCRSTPAELGMSLGPDLDTGTGMALEHGIVAGSRLEILLNELLRKAWSQHNPLNARGGISMAFLKLGGGTYKTSVIQEYIADIMSLKPGRGASIMLLNWGTLPVQHLQIQTGVPAWWSISWGVLQAWCFKSLAGKLAWHSQNCIAGTIVLRLGSWANTMSLKQGGGRSTLLLNPAGGKCSMSLVVLRRCNWARLRQCLDKFKGSRAYLRQKSYIYSICSGSI